MSLKFSNKCKLMNFHHRFPQNFKKLKENISKERETAETSMSSKIMSKDTGLRTFYSLARNLISILSKKICLYFLNKKGKLSLQSRGKGEYQWVTMKKSIRFKNLRNVGRNFLKGNTCIETWCYHEFKENSDWFI